MESKRLKSLSVSNLYAKKFKRLPLPETGDFIRVLSGDMPRGGIWLVHGDEKQGKTTLCLSLANWLSQTNKVLYVQSEQSTNETDVDKLFVESMQRVGIENDNRMLGIFGDLDNDEIVEILGRRRSADIVLIDNLTTAKWVNTQVVRKLNKTFKDKLFIYVTHNDRNGDPDGSTGKAIRRLANTIFSVTAGRADVIGRGDWGGTLDIDWQNGKIMYGTDSTDGQPRI